MAKPINEKTFELNITSELLNVSKSFIWYLDQSPVSHLLPRHVWNRFLQPDMFYAVGLTQEEEAAAGGGYDVSINLNNTSPFDKRLLLLQFKSGLHRERSNSTQSQFHPSNRSPKHIQFRFNDAANMTQHIILRNLANRSEIQSESVMYVFPRVTTSTDFQNKLGSLIWHSSFVPVLELDRQAANQNPPLSINAGVSHNFRTSYDGATSEVNYYYYNYDYNSRIILDFLLELICIQIERLAKSLLEIDKSLLDIIFKFQNISEFVNPRPDLELNGYLILNTFTFVRQMENEFLTTGKILTASTNYSTIIPKDGLKMRFGDDNLNYSEISYQIF